MSVVCNMWIWENTEQQVASAHEFQSEQAISMPLSPAQRQARELVLGKPTELQHLDEEFQRDP
eukprot:5192678-Amphidinium_carterae.1